MVRFAVGEQVIIRWGRHQGQTAKVLKNELANVYMVKTGDGFVSSYSDKGLEKTELQAQQLRKDVR
jgi:hypothetical protein